MRLDFIFFSHPFHYLLSPPDQADLFNPSLLPLFLHLLVLSFLLLIIIISLPVLITAIGCSFILNFITEYLVREEEAIHKNIKLYKINIKLL